MYKIDSVGSVNGQFSDGNYEAGQKGTKVPARWLNSLQDEICNLITKSGGVLNEYSETQMLTAIRHDLPKLLHYEVLSNVKSTGIQNISGQTTIFNLSSLFENCEGKYVDINIEFTVVDPTDVPNSYFAAGLFIAKRNGTSQNVAFYSMPSTEINSMTCRWSVEIPDDIAEDNPVVLYVFSRTDGTTVNPSIGIMYDGAVLADPNNFIL